MTRPSSTYRIRPARSESAVTELDEYGTTDSTDADEI